MAEIMYLVKRIKNGYAETEFLGEGAIQRVRMIQIRSYLGSCDYIEVYGGSRYTQRYKGTISTRYGKPIWTCKKRKGYMVIEEKRYIKPDGTLGKMVE